MTYLNNPNNLTVSVIVPVYNVKPYISEALDSVINQTYKNLEIIVVDDGSDDGSEKICDEYAKKDNRIKVIHRENGGLSAARNTGLDNMSGDYVAFLDSDDVLLNDAVEKSVNNMLSYDVDCVVFRIGRIKSGKVIMPVRPSPRIKQGRYSKKEALQQAVDGTLGSAVWNKLYKCEIWKNLRFPEGHVYEEIYIALNVYAKATSIYVTDEVLILYRNRKGSITDTNSAENIRYLFDSWLVSINFIITHIPEIFDDEQLQKARKKNYEYFIIFYAKILSSSFQGKQDVLSVIKEHIAHFEKSVQIKDCRIEIRLIHYMIFRHKLLLSMFFTPFLRIYQLIQNILWVITR